MSRKFRRFEVLLPVQFNDGREVPPEWIAEAVLYPDLQVEDMTKARRQLRQLRKLIRGIGGICG